jgi:8-oxo-dGTP pyrophosphatase MutT (NUDIX family)
MEAVDSAFFKENGLHLMTTHRIRPLALCIFHHDGKILLSEAHDPIKNRPFFRPIGGGIEFGETSAEAIEREVQEELGLAITDVRLLGTRAEGEVDRHEGSGTDADRLKQCEWDSAKP